MSLGKQASSISNKDFLSKVLYKVGAACKFYELLDPKTPKLRSKIDDGSKFPATLGFAEVDALKFMNSFMSIV